MQIKFLPDFQKLQRNLLLGIKELLQKRRHEQLSKETVETAIKVDEATRSAANLSSHINLFEEDETFTSGQNVRENFIVFSKGVIVFVSALFALILFYNFYLDLRLADNKADLDILFAEASQYEEERLLALQIDKKVSSYKNIVDNRKLFGNKTEVVLSSLAPGMEVLDFRIDEAQFVIVVKGTEVLSFSKLINRYLDSGLLAQIVLISADLSPSENSFTVELRGDFK